MVGQFDPSAKAWVAGKGRSAEWTHVPWIDKSLKPQYLMHANDYSTSKCRVDGYALTYMKISSSTNSRTFIGTVVRDLPSVYSLCLLVNDTFTLPAWLQLSACLNSFVYDFALRQRLGGLNITGYVLKHTPVLASTYRNAVADIAARLSFPHARFAVEWLTISRNIAEIGAQPWRALWAITEHERARLRCILDALMAEYYNLDVDELRWILRDCDHPVEDLQNPSVAGDLDLKGFWRVDKTKDPELRHTVLSLVAFLDLRACISEQGSRGAGVDTFCNMNNGNGWQLPEALRLADFGLGHDDRAQSPQPVRDRLGPRFYDWQLDQSVEESWVECEMHARSILGEKSYEGFVKSLDKAATYQHKEEHLIAAEPTPSFAPKGSTSKSTQRATDSNADGQGQLFDALEGSKDKA
jgi:hypothetical protein